MGRVLRGCLILIGGAVVLIVLLAVIGAAINGGARAGTSATPTPSAPPAIVLDVRGSGIKTTQTFSVRQNWDMGWSYDCADAGGSPSRNAGTNQLGASGSDTEHFHTGGTFYLEVNSECSWHIAVED